MAKVYRLSGDERYAEEWTKQYLDWIKKNPLLTPSKEEMDTMGIDMLKKMENVRFAWRTLEVSERIEVQTVLFLYFLKSEHFTPAFLTEFLLNFYRHAEHVRGNFSEKGNFLLFESQRMIYAGTIFPEFKQAEVWRNTGIDILNQEIKNQVYDDGFQYELDPHYHIHSIYIFVKAIKVADCNGFKNEFSDVYLHTVEKMIMAVIDISYPDYRLPCFSDNRQASKTEMLRDLRSWSELFPHNKYIRYMATEGKEGILPSHLSKSYPTAGFYVFRNGWGKDATIMILKAGPQAFWHNQPDNGTFEMYFKGRNFFPDSGCFVYGGDDKVNAERAWFRQTRVHNTLTLNKNNIENTNSKCLLWDADSAVEKLVIENQSYVDLTHRRAVFFVDKSFFVIVDEAEGNAIGDVAIHYQLSEGDVDVSPQQLKLNTRYHDNNNILIQGFGNKGTQLLQEEGWVSYVYRVKHKRPAISFLTHKNSTDTVRFITVIYPISDKTPKVSACFKSALQNNINVLLKINGKKYNLEAKW
jgi:heparan-sulfate lyase